MPFKSLTNPEESIHLVRGILSLCVIQRRLTGLQLLQVPRGEPFVQVELRHVHAHP
jgi:hypothetical protein